MRLIDADALYKVMQDAEELARRRVLDTESTLPYPTNLNPAYTRYLAQMDERIRARRMVESAPSVDAVPVRRGNWVGIDQEPCEMWECDRCGYVEECEDGEQTDFCPGCGADMREVDDE